MTESAFESKRLAALALSAAFLAFPCFCPGAVFTVSNTLDSGAGSLRQAILDANASPGTDVIVFQISGSGVRTVSPLSALPPVLDPVVINGTTQPGYAGQPLVELNGAGAGSNGGLRVLSGGSTILGLAINSFAGSGIQLEAGGTNVVGACYLGTDPTGTLARPNGLEGVWIYNSSGNVIGGLNAAYRNVISGNADHGVYIQAGGGNFVQGNYIGVAASGAVALGNGANGVTLYSAPGNQVGGAPAGTRNVISGNRGSGIYLNGSGASQNVIQGNFIGVGAGGGGALSNAADGITVNGAGGNVVGGTNPGEGNVISGNGKAGLFFTGVAATANRVQGNSIGVDATGRVAMGNAYAGISFLSAPANVIGGSVSGAGNVISGNLQDGVFLSTNSFANTVSGNFIGVDATGTNALPNLYNGISVFAANSNLVGGQLVAERNIISGNAYYGIQITAGAAGTAVKGNYIGPDLTGSRAVRNGGSGVRLESASSFIGAPGAGNVISGNGLDGVSIVGAAASNNVVQGNLVGLAAGGNGPLANGRAGVGISGAPGNLVGGASAGAGNVLSANADAGIYLVAPAATGNQVFGNRIGTDATGTAAMGNTLEGIYLEGAAGNWIGADVSGAGNLISANHTRGVFLTNAPGNRLQRNLIGTQIDGVSPLGNTFHNVECESGASNNQIGGAGFSAGNRIAFAQGVYAGVRIRDGSTGNAILGNAIFGNGALGIDLGAAGVAPNDPCDADAGANQLQNWPVLTQAVSGAQTGVRGTFNSAPNQACVLQFFASPACDSSGNGEGQVYLGDAAVALSSACSADFLVSLPVQVPAGWQITATATDPAGNSSEFSNCSAVAAVPALQYSVTADRQLLISWADTAAGLVLKQTSSLSPPVAWTDVSASPVLANGVWSVKLPVSSAGSSYFGLVFQ